MVTSWTDETSRTDWFETEEDGIRVHWLPVRYDNRMSYRRRLHAFGAFALRADDRARRIGGDVVFATSTPLTIAIPGVRASRALRVPMVFEVRDLWPEMPIAMGALRNPVLRRAAQALERYAYRNAAHVVALSPGMRDGVLRVRPDAEVSVVPNSCDLDLFNPERTGPELFLSDKEHLRGETIVSYSGTFGAVNGVDYLARIAAASAAKGANIKYVAVGDGAATRAIRAEAQRMGVLGRNFFMYPQIAKREMPSLMRATSLPLSLFVDIREMQVNSANKFFDALASGNAIGLNYGGWQADLVRSCGLGIVLPPTDAERSAGKILEFLADPRRVREAGHRARQTAEELFDREKLARQLEEILQGALGKNAGSRRSRLDGSFVEGDTCAD